MSRTRTENEKRRRSDPVKGYGEKFSQVLRRLIKESGIPEKELARHVPVSEAAFLSYIHQKNNPSVESLALLADYFAVPADLLLGRCTKEQEEMIFRDYGRNFMKLRRIAYEHYLTGKYPSFPYDEKREEPWPYNLYRQIAGEAKTVLSRRQEKNLLYIIERQLAGNRKACVYEYFRNGKSLSEVAEEGSISREWAKKLIQTSIYCLRTKANIDLLRNDSIDQEAVERKTEELSRLIDTYRELIEKESKKAGRPAMVLRPEESWKELYLLEAGLSQRAVNSLNREDVTKMGEVYELMMTGRLGRVRGIGKNGAEEIERRIRDLKIEFGDI